ncbi:microtubule-associated protein 70-5-like [Vicia villosa]|uniref:microtubule-associated protein 70-5-like n=1 Tax=Vicia villosa TaxID=3911 RepID=UPI00273AA713|nr:microtubule-associated protein 70-5-like [Vicia villosa]
MVRCKKLYGEELPLVLSDPVVFEINHLQNQFKEKVKELTTCQNEIKTFKATESLKDKAIQKLRNETCKLDERLLVTEDHLKQKNLEIKKLRDDKKEALAAKYAAEATLRRVHANQKNEDYVPIDNSVIANGATANIVRDYQRQISELQEEKRTLERELARAKVSANRIANVVANEWKDESLKALPPRQWQEEKRILKKEMQRLKDKIAKSERTAKGELQLKEKLKVRLKTLEEGLKHFSSYSNTSNVFSWTPKVESPMKMNYTSADMSLNCFNDESEAAEIGNIADLDEEDFQSKKPNDSGGDDLVSGFLYVRLQKEVIKLRKSCVTKDSSLQDKDEEIKVLMKKVVALSKVMEVERKKMKREKEISSTKSSPDDNMKNRNTNSSKRAMKER